MFIEFKFDPENVKKFITNIYVGNLPENHGDKINITDSIHDDIVKLLMNKGYDEQKSKDICFDILKHIYNELIAIEGVN